MAYECYVHVISYHIYFINLSFVSESECMPTHLFKQVLIIMIFAGMINSFLTKVNFLVLDYLIYIHFIGTEKIV